MRALPLVLSLLLVAAMAAPPLASGRYQVSGGFTCGEAPITPTWCVAVYRPGLNMVKVLMFDTPFSQSDLDKAVNSQGAWVGCATLALHLIDGAGTSLDVGKIKSFGVYVKCPGQPFSEVVTGRFVARNLLSVDGQLRDGSPFALTSNSMLGDLRMDLDVRTVLRVAP